MHQLKFIWIILLIAFQFSNNLCAQEKFEKESRIRQSDVPAKAFHFFDSSDFQNKIKWYQEEGLKRKSIEAKLKHNKLKYSIEFDTLGNVEDIETEANWEELNSQLKDSISFHLKSDCFKYKIDKVQIQYTGIESELFTMIKTHENNQHLTIKYELIVKCTLQNKVELYEYLFSAAGKPLSISIILFKNSSHLEY